MLNEIGHQRWKPIILIVRKAVFDRHVFPFDIASFFQAATKSVQELGVITRPSAAEETDHRHRRLLRTHRERPTNRRAADRGYELSPSDVDCHLIRPQWDHARSNVGKGITPKN